MTTFRRMENGGGGSYAIRGEYITSPDVATLIKPTLEPIKVMGWPTGDSADWINGGGPIMKDTMYRGDSFDPIYLEQLRRLKEAQVVAMQDQNGDVIKVAVDENGEVVAAEKKNPIVPLAVAAAVLFALFGG